MLDWPPLNRACRVSTCLSLIPARIVHVLLTDLIAYLHRSGEDRCISPDYYNFIYANALSLIDRITLTSRSGVILADMESSVGHHHTYLSVASLFSDNLSPRYAVAALAAVGLVAQYPTLYFTLRRERNTKKESE